MTAYVIVDIEVHNTEKYPEYLAQITPTVLDCGGRYLVRGANAEIVSGDWQKPFVAQTKTRKKNPSLNPNNTFRPAEQNIPIASNTRGEIRSDNCPLSNCPKP